MPEKFPGRFLVAPLLFTLLYYQVFITDYCYLDEIHQLWYNNDGGNFRMFTTQGRLLSGILFDKLFASISEINQIKYLRIFSFCGWVAVTLLWQILFSRWSRLLQIDKKYEIITTIFITCCIPVAVYVGWASCVEMFFGVAAGLLSGHLFFMAVLKKVSYIKFFLLVLTSTFLGLASLFIYQNTFGIFLLPFFIYYLQQKIIKPKGTILKAAFFYLLVYVIYYFVFKYSMKLEGIQESNRVGISYDLLGKLSFLFSDPLPSAFSVNLLYTARSIFSQVLAPLMMATWMISVFIRFKNRKFYFNLLYIIAVLFFLVLMYIPSMIAIENFASYRTLFAFHLAVFYLLVDQAFFFLKKPRIKKIFPYAICLFLIVTGFYNYNFQFVNPVKTEHKAFMADMKSNMNAEIDTVYFIRADRFLFDNLFHTRPYKDEFGLPSTNKDWVPEPLIKQYLFELTGNRKRSEKIKVIQFDNTIDFINARIELSKADLLIDMNGIVPRYVHTK